MVGNPPYITVKDSVLRERYREMYVAAAGKYAVAAPFTQRFFQLARAGGAVGMITANSFMKREFGKALIEQFLPTVNLDLVVNTSGAYIPGHGTPTVLLFGTAEAPTGSDVLAVLAKRGEPTTPDDPEQGLVWRSIAEHWQDATFENDYVSGARVPRGTLSKYPWSLGGGGVSELKELIEDRCGARLRDVVDDVGFASFTGLDDAFMVSASAAPRLGLGTDIVRPMVIGECVRDWAANPEEVAIVPYDLRTQQPLALNTHSEWAKFLWHFRTVASNVASFGGKTRAEEGQSWWHWYRWQSERYLCPFRITFAFVATHNHFVLDRGGKVFNRSAPIIKLPETATEDDHLALLAYLNSSTACFWMKQVFQPKSSIRDVGDTRDKPERTSYEFTGTGLLGLPIPTFALAQRAALIRLGMAASTAAEQREALSGAWFVREHANGSQVDDAATVEAKRANLLCAMVTAQEEIDWIVYTAFGLAAPTPEGSEPARPDDRPFLAGEGSRHSNTWRERAKVIASSAELPIIEHVVYKRPWLGRQGVFGHSTKSFDEEVRNAASAWLQDATEKALGATPAPQSRGEIARGLGATGPAQRVAKLIDPEGLADQVIRSLALDEVPFLAILSHTDAGLVKRAAWEQTWALQRREDAGEKVGEIPVPPRYDVKDFRDQSYWSLRGKLDVPKERFISYPGCESDEDGEPVYGWAGWNHLERAQALAALYQKRKNEEAWGKERLTPMLAGLLELLPWVVQWHNEPSDEYGGMRLGDFFDGFLDGECRALGLTRDDLRAWRPAEKRRGGKAKAKAVAPATAEAEGEPAPKKKRGRKAGAGESGEAT